MVRLGKGFDFTPNPTITKQIEEGPLMGVALGVKADMAAERAREIAPVDSGEYRDGIQGTSGQNDSGKYVGRVVARDWKSGWIEFGTIYREAQAVLRRAVGG